MTDEALGGLAQPVGPGLFETADGVEVILPISGRAWLATEILGRRDDISDRALRLLLEFLDERFRLERKAFCLTSIEVYAERSPETGDFSLRYGFEGDDFGYTYFDVSFFRHEPPQERFWPFKFTIGFH